MSEYQYYEFRAVDRPLTAKEQAQVAKLSSRVQLSSTQAIFVYNYGDFRGDPEDVLTQYFDMMFYIANWGTWQLMFRFPKAIANINWFRPYKIDRAITVTQTRDYIILDITISEEEGIGWGINGESWMSRLLPLRDELLRGDMRLLYLAWLRAAPDAVGYGLETNPLEPPIPANLGQPSEGLDAFMELVELDSDLVTAAAQASPSQKPKSDPPLENMLPQLSEPERQAFLLKLVRREPHVDLQLINRLKELAGVGEVAPQGIPGQRHLDDLRAIANDTTEVRQHQEQEAAQKNRIAELNALAAKETQTWERVVDLIGYKQSKYYDEAAALLKDLRDLAQHQGRSPEFAQRLKRLKSDYSNRPALMRRFRAVETGMALR
ncbi:MAG: hypothetical protein WBA10_13360 [Elainellaceae cyanobacterium]